MFQAKSFLFSWLCLQIVLTVITVQANPADATVCAPLSRFKIDCNTCYCSVDGRRYTCSKRFCTSDVSLNYNDFMSDAPGANDRIYYNEPSEDWVNLMNELADNVDNDDKAALAVAPRYWANEENEFEDNGIDYGDYLKDDTGYIGSRPDRYRY